VIETIVLKIGKVILSKLIWIGIGALLTLLLFATLCKSKPQTVTVYTTDTLMEYVYKDTTEIVDTVYIEGETIYIDSTTTMAEIPIRTHVQDYIRTLISDKQILPLKQTIETDYRGIIYAQRRLPQNDTFTIEVPGESALQLWGNLGVGYDIADGHIPACLEVGIKGWKRISISAQAIYLDKIYPIGWVKVWF